MSLLDLDPLGQTSLRTGTVRQTECCLRASSLDPQPAQVFMSVKEVNPLIGGD